MKHYTSVVTFFFFKIGICTNSNFRKKNTFVTRFLKVKLNCESKNFKKNKTLFLQCTA